MRAHATATRRKGRSGQTALEYILVFALLLAAAGAAYHFMRAPARVAVYSTDVICSERL